MRGKEERADARLDGRWYKEVVMVRNTADPFEEDDPRHPAHGVEAKLKAVREAVLWAFPTAEIAQMLDEIERGGDR